jgi:hypothetical protein
MASIEQRVRPPVLRALMSLGFFPLLVMGLGGFSVIDIIEKAILEREFDLIAPFEFLLSGYQRVTGWLADIVEPLFAPLVLWINDLFGWRLELQPHWRSLFVLGLTWAARIWRVYATQRDHPNRRDVFVVCIGLAAAALIGALVAGLAPAETTWLSQGMSAAAPIAFLSLGYYLWTCTLTPDTKLWEWLACFGVAFATGAVLFALAAALSLAPGMERAAGLTLLGAAVIFLGLREFKRRPAGDVTDESMLTTGKFGLTILGGFMAAALILLSNAVVSAI